MIQELLPYSSMRETSANWLGSVPEHWQVLRAKYLFREADERSVDGSETHLSMSQKLGLVPSSMVQRTLISESYAGGKLCEPGDLVLNRLKAHLGVFACAKLSGVISPDYTVLRPVQRLETLYFEEVLRSPTCRGELRTRAKGIVEGFWRLYTDDFYDIRLPVPPLEEQAAIVTFLAHVNQLFRRYIDAKEKLIKLLEEQKQVIIHQAVTRGLDPDVRMKPAGVEWLEEIPEHWTELNLGRALSQIEQGWSPVAAEGDITEEQWTVLTLSSVKKGVFNPKAIKPIPITAEVPQEIEIQNGDLLLTRSNTRELVGDVCIVEHPRPKTILCDLIYRLTPQPNIFTRRFLMFQLLGPVGRYQIERDARGSSGTMPKISQRLIRSWRVFAPPPEEQLSIANFVQDSVEQLNNASLKIEKELDLLQEYRVRLISDVVTGQLDVRKAASALPELVYEVSDSTGEAPANLERFGKENKPLEVQSSQLTLF